MKQIIVMVSMVLLGIAVAGFVMDFSGSAEEISNNAKASIEDVITSGAID